MDPIILSPSKARKIILHAAGLSKVGQFGKGKEAVYKLIDHLGFVQVDTNYVVERAHHHAIAARVPGYRPKWLEELQEEGRIFEFWTYASGYIPMKEYRFSLPLQEAFLSRRKPLLPKELHVMKTVLDRISRDGSLMARDFENDRVVKSKGWWDWRPSKLALERLHLEGKLITSRKGNFQKVYDLPENIIPGNTDISPPSSEEFARYVIRRSLKALGIGYLKDIARRGWYVRKNPVKAELEKMVKAGEVCQVEVVGIKGQPLYMLSEYQKKKISLSGDTFILSPFDTLIVFRSRLKFLFDFDYMVECFVPKPRRKYGYFSLPILIGDTFVARMDSKADRKQRTLIIHNLHFESVKLTNPMITRIFRSIRNFAAFNQCDKIIVEKCNKKEIGKMMRKIG